MFLPLSGLLSLVAFLELIFEAAHEPSFAELFEQLNNRLEIALCTVLEPIAIDTESDA